MKKTKVVIPALGIIAFATAASITGTVAWFTSQRTAAINTDFFTVVKTDGSLAVSLTAGVGTALHGSNNQIDPVTVSETKAKLGDFSWNPSTKQGWNDTGAGTAYRTIGDADDYLTLTDSGHPYKINATTYFAFTWKVTLTYTWGADYTDVNVFFDQSASSMTGQVANAEAAAAADGTQTGFRIAMVTEDKVTDDGLGHTIVYAGLQTAANLETVTGTADEEAYGTAAAGGHAGCANAKYSYFASNGCALGNVTAASAAVAPAHADDDTASQRSRVDYLGTIKRSGEEDASTLDITCIAWYEGTDPNIVTRDGIEMDKVKATLGFYTAVNKA